MPALYDTDKKNSETLIIKMKEKASGAILHLYYGVWEEENVITRTASLTNAGKEPIYIEKFLSCSMDMMDRDLDLISFTGRHAMERTAERIPVQHAKVEIGSTRGTSSHHYNPAVILCEEGADETHGSCIGACLVYSGNFVAAAQKDQKNQTRFQMGIHPTNFCFHLEKGEAFDTPQAILSYSGTGLTKLSQQYHEIIREHICRGAYKHAKRPILINNWEATYFDFNEEKILKIAEQAQKLGIEMLVLDDGWFGKREDDNSGLGDWFVNEKKMNGSMAQLAEKIHRMGMKFGLWFEPEMISEDSDLYRAHPDWAFAIPGRVPNHSRNQLVLDFANPEVVDHIYEQIAAVLRQGDINYVKWDMNRSLCDIYSDSMVWQGNVMYDYMLGVYDLLERLTQAFPDMLWEGCSGGGGRFDMGMLYYTPQIWCSDNTDAVDRIRIQYGTSFAYPLSTMGAHVSAVPNHQTGRVTDMNTRGVVAMTGAFGYELDLGKLSEEDKTAVREQIKTYHEAASVILKGDYYRLSNPFEAEYGAWMSVDEEKKHAVVGAVLLNTHGNHPVFYIRLRGLAPERSYRDKKTGTVYSGAALMELGMPFTVVSGNYPSYQILLDAVE